MPGLVGYLLLFLVVGIGFILILLLAGKLIRPSRPDPEKMTIYECGEPTIGSAWVQFDLRYYVVALLFVVFDVEVAFFFPWAVVFGNANTLAQNPDNVAAAEVMKTGLPPLPQDGAVTAADLASVASSWAWVSFVDILVFFAVLMVGFAYLWRR